MALSCMRNGTAGTVQFGGDVGVAVHEAVHRERQIGCDTQTHRPYDRVQNVEVVMQEALAGALDEPVIIAARRGMARFIGDEGGALFHALEDYDNAGVSLERAVVGSDHLLLADTLRCRQDRDPVLLGVAVQPAPIGGGTPRQHLRRNPWVAAHVVEEVNDVLRSLQARIVAAQDDAVPARVAELDETPEELQESIHEPVLLGVGLFAHSNLNLPQEGRFMSSAPVAHHHPSPTRPVTNYCLPPAAFRFTWLGVSGLTEFPQIV